uniref:Transposase n=1 Tax=Burkholderia cenocepacia TaxID=95486 RepID=A0A071M552_9BURK
MELNLRIKPRKRLVRQVPQPLAVPCAANQVWSMGFMHDQLANGRSIRLFNVIDDFNRKTRTTCSASRLIGCGLTIMTARTWPW